LFTGIYMVLSVGFIGILFVGVIYFLSWFILREKQSSLGGYNSLDNRHDLEGAIGEAKSDLRPSGIGRFDDENVDVIADGEFIPRGAAICVIKIKEGKVIVRPVE
jgi:membrane-bound serine protease (ClpP class)